MNARFICELMNYEPHLAFVIRKFIRERSIMVFIFYTVTLCIIAGVLLRMFEFDTGDERFDYVDNGIWLASLT